MALDLSDVKAALRVTHDEDDAEIQRLLDAAKSEFERYTGIEASGADKSAEHGMVLMVQAGYDGNPEKRSAYRDAAEALWWPSIDAEFGV